MILYVVLWKNALFTLIKISSVKVITLRRCVHGTGSNCNRDIPGTDWPRVSMGLLGTVTIGTADRFQPGLHSN